MEQDSCQTVSFRLFLLIWNATQKQQTPNLHVRIANWLQRSWEHGRRRLVLQAFRACGKSTLIGIFSAWALYRDPDLRILVLAAESRLSNKMVRTIRKVIERHPLTQHLIPTNPDEWAADRFTVTRSRVSRDPSVLACGIYANITGARADVIICDDVEVPNTCDSAEKRAKLRERLSENEFILVPGGRHIFIGTPHTYYSIYAKKPRKEIGEETHFLQNYTRLSLPVITAGGNSQWPERYSLEDIEEIRRQSGPMKFASQMMLDPVNIKDSRLDPALLNRYDDEIVYSEVQKETILTIGGVKMVSASAWWDPAFGSAKGDNSVLAVVYTSVDGNYYLHRMDYIKVTPKDGEDEAHLQSQRIAQIVRDLYLPSITVETNGIGKFLPAILRNVINNAKVPCAVQEAHSTKAKDTRILESFDTAMAARSLYVHCSVFDTPFLSEMQEWRPGRKYGRDDGLDAAAGAIALEPMRLPRSYGDSKRRWGAKAHKAKTILDT